MGNIFHLIIVLTIFFQRSKCTHWLMNNILFFQLHLVAIWYAWTFISYNLIIFFPNMRGVTKEMFIFPYSHWNTFNFLRCLKIIQAYIDPLLIHKFKALFTGKHFFMRLVCSCLIYEDTGNRPTTQTEPTFKSNHAWVSWTKNIAQVKFIPPLRISEEVIAVSI